MNDAIVVSFLGDDIIPPDDELEVLPCVSGSGFSGTWQKTAGGKTITITLSESSYKMKTVDSLTAQGSLTTITVYQGWLGKIIPQPDGQNVQAREFAVSKAFAYLETPYTISGDTLTLSSGSGVSETYTRANPSGGSEAQQ